jgi:hypothetical protein
MNALSKSEQKYERILEVIEGEKRLRAILYLSWSTRFFPHCAGISGAPGKRFSSPRWTILKEHVLDARVDFANMFRRMTLREALTRCGSG